MVQYVLCNFQVQEGPEVDFGRGQSLKLSGS